MPRIYNNPFNLTLEEKMLLKKAKSFWRTGPHGNIIWTDNHCWWRCHYYKLAIEFLKKNGAEELLKQKNV